MGMRQAQTAARTGEDTPSIAFSLWAFPRGG
jgi:hypothetical protein